MLKQLEVYYRYLPLYKLDKPDEGGGPPMPAAGKPDAAKPEAKPEEKKADK